MECTRFEISIAVIRKSKTSEDSRIVFKSDITLSKEAIEEASEKKLEELLKDWKDVSLMDEVAKVAKKGY